MINSEDEAVAATVDDCTKFGGEGDSDSSDNGSSCAEAPDVVSCDDIPCCCCCCCCSTEDDDASRSAAASAGAAAEVVLVVDEVAATAVEDEDELELIPNTPPPLDDDDDDTEDGGWDGEDVGSVVGATTTAVAAGDDDDGGDDDVDITAFTDVNILFQLIFTRLRGGPIGGICCVASARYASFSRCGWVDTMFFQPTVSTTSVA